MKHPGSPPAAGFAGSEGAGPFPASRRRGQNAASPRPLGSNADVSVQPHLSYASRLNSEYSNIGHITALILALNQGTRKSHLHVQAGGPTRCPMSSSENFS